MNIVNMELDKTVPAMQVDNYGEIGIRVVVLHKISAVAMPAITDEEADQQELGIDPGDDPKVKNPVDSFLEAPGTRGKLCCVFLVNGQRQHAWDNTFITQDLEFKYLRNRMLLIIDVDSMRPEAIAQLMQGSRHQFYEGEVYAALTRRLIDVLKADPDLINLEDEAEQEILSLKTGDEVVRQALDELIDAHHEHGDHTVHGSLQPGSDTRNEYMPGGLKQTITTVLESDNRDWTEVQPPILAVLPDTMAIRLHPGEDKTVYFVSKPSDFMSKLDRFVVTANPSVQNLHIKHIPKDDKVAVELVFNEIDRMEDDEYPIETTLKAVAKFKDVEDSRTCERRLVITARRTTEDGDKNKEKKKRDPKPLLDTPTYLRVTSRPPIRMAIDGPDVHVKLKWDGKDELVIADNPAWKFRATVIDSPHDLVPSFTDPKDGKFHLLLRAPQNLSVGETVKVSIEAIGPDNVILAADCEIVAIENPTARRVTQTVPGGAARKPPYVLKIVRREDWNTGTCWGGRQWTTDDPAAFQAPTDTSPLVLLINDDAGMLLDARERMIKKKLVEATLEQRNRKYQSHIAYHLWQMYLWLKDAQEASPDQSKKIPQDEDFRMEIRRVAGTLLQLMGVMQ